MDALNTHWHIWVLGYDARRQEQLFDWLGLDLLKPLGVALAMVAALGVIMAVLGYGLLRRRGARPDPARKLYDLFCRRLAAVGVRRAAHEGPENFARRAGRARRDLELPIRRISALYCRLRYGGEGSKERLRELERLVRRFRPKRNGRQKQR